MTSPLTILGTAAGGLLTIGGAVLLVLAFRHGQAGRVRQERTTFRLAVAGLATGSLLFFAVTAAGDV